MSLMNQLFGRGVFDLILEKIFLLLDGPSLGACSLVCKEWQRFILKLFKRKVSLCIAFAGLYFYLGIFC